MAKVLKKSTDIQALVGREDEVNILQNLLHTKEAELVAIYGRRRVGKSFLIKRAYEAETIFEERRNGVTIGGVIKYFNQKLKEYYSKQNIDSELFLWAGFIPPDEFLTSLNKSTRISIADIYLTKSVLGSEALDLLGDTDYDCREELVLTMKSRKKES